MALLNTSLRTQLRNLLDALPRPVTLLVFGGVACDTCGEAREFVEELASISEGKVRIEVHDLDVNPPEARLYRIDKAPALVVLGDETGRRDFGIRFYGSPAGYEFATLIEDIRMASRGTTDLLPATLEALSHLTAPLHLQVFVTPTCPYCPRAALLAHKLAIVSEWVTADAVAATEFPELANRYHVHGVPRTVVNDTVLVEGAVPEAILMAELIPILEAQATASGAGQRSGRTSYN
jgi:glutaredoxin-like protein